MNNPLPRIVIAALTLSAAGFVGIAIQEGYVPEAMIPTKGDRPTVGFGSTTHADGRPVRLGERMDPIAALRRTMIYTQKADADIKRCVKVPLHQAEYDLYADFVYQYGAARFCSSSIVTNLNRGEYVRACDALLEYKFAAGYDCSTPGNRRCPGVWTRQLKRHATCMAAQ